MNRQIRRLGIALIACFTVLFVQLNYIQVVRQEELNDDPRNTRKIVEEFSRPRGTIITADGVVLARSTESNDAVQVPAGVPGGRAVRARHRLLQLHLRGHRPRGDLQRRALRPHPRDRPAQRCPTSSSTDEDVGNVTLTIRKDVQQVARDALGDQAGLGRRARPAGRRDPRLLEQPVLRPEPAVGPRPIGQRGQGVPRGRPGQAAAARRCTARCSSPARRSRS